MCNVIRELLKIIYLSESWDIFPEMGSFFTSFYVSEITLPKFVIQISILSLDDHCSVLECLKTAPCLNRAECQETKR